MHVIGCHAVGKRDREHVVEDRLSAAENQVARNPENTIFEAKRLIDREVADPIVQADIKLLIMATVEGQ